MAKSTAIIKVIASLTVFNHFDHPRAQRLRALRGRIIGVSFGKEPSYKRCRRWRLRTDALCQHRIGRLTVLPPKGLSLDPSKMAEAEIPQVKAQSIF